jgi:hypothetical protein
LSKETVYDNIYGGQEEKKSSPTRERIKSFYAPCYQAKFPVLSEVHCKERGVRKCPMAMTF